jgi:hypothetical protein
MSFIVLTNSSCLQLRRKRSHADGRSDQSVAASAKTRSAAAWNPWSRFGFQFFVCFFFFFFFFFFFLKFFL